MQKSVPIAYLLWLVLGTMGLHRFYLRDYGWGILYLCTGGLFMIGWFADAFLIPGKVDGLNRRIESETSGLVTAKVVRRSILGRRHDG